MALVDNNPVPEVADDRRYYKYMTRSTARLVLGQRTLRWSTPRTLNDPFDNQFELHAEIDPERVKQLAMQRLWEDYSAPELVPNDHPLRTALILLRAVVPRRTREQFEREFEGGIANGLARSDELVGQMQEQLRPYVAQHKLLCLTATPNDALMWAYYAEQHQGVVLGFRSVPGLDSPWPAGQAVRYQAEMPRLCDDDTLADVMSGRSSLENEALLQKIVFTKSIEWAHEQEWRVFSGPGRNPDAPNEDITFAAQELEAVILGCRMPEADRTEITNLSRRLYPHAEVLEVVRRQRYYGFDIEPYPGYDTAPA